jgi:hypothetical protein
MKKNAPRLLAALAVAALLSACGGGDEGAVVDEREPTPSGRSATMTVTAANETALNGIYTTNNVSLNNVTKVNPIGGDPETCRFRFSGLVQGGTGTRLMDGDIRYIPGNENLRTTFVSINSVEFRLEGSTGARVDRTGDRVVYTGAVLTSTQGTGNTITITGAIPMLGDRPEGC